MKRRPVMTIAAVGAGLVAVGIAWRWARPVAPPAVSRAKPLSAAVLSTPPPSKPADPRGEPAPSHPPAAPLPAEVVARAEKIRRDYEEMRAKAAADYAAAGVSFPGGLNAFLRQLALLEREKRADLAAVLGAAELENTEMRETPAGQGVQRLLGGTAATEEQRRAVFRLQREFDDQFGTRFDPAPAMLVAREAARQALQERIRAALGDELFGLWLRGEGDDFAQFRSFAARQALPAALPLELWQAKNEFVLRRLELATQPGISPEQLRVAQAVLAQQYEVRVATMIGPALLPVARAEILGWLPRR